MKSRTFTTLVDATNLDAGTVYYTIPCQKVSDLSIGMVCTGGVTVTFEATMESDPKSEDWVDITKSFYSQNTGEGGHGSGGQGAANFVDKTDIVVLHDSMHQFIRVKSITTDATNAVKIIACVEGDSIQLSE